MTQLQHFINSCPMGFLDDKKIDTLVGIDPLHQVLVRCGACRFTCAAQDVKHLVKCIQFCPGDYVRDVAFLARDVEAAEAAMRDEQSRRFVPRYDVARHIDYTGADDGMGNCVSDADPGLILTRAPVNAVAWASPILPVI